MDSPYTNASAPPAPPPASAPPKGRSSQGPTLYDIPKNYKDNRRSPVHCAFVLYSAFAALTAVNLIVGQVWAFAVASLAPMEILLRLYTIGLCLLAILTESERFGLTRNSPIVQNWIFRGLFYTFLGVLGVVENDIGSDNEWSSYRERFRNYSESETNEISIPTGEDCVEFYIFIISWMMFAVGIVYAAMGACCLQRQLNSHREDYQRRCADTLLEGDGY